MLNNLWSLFALVMIDFTLIVENLTCRAKNIIYLTHAK